MGSEATRSHWARWHDDYDDPSSQLSWRLGVVQHRLREAIDRTPPGRVSLLSLCAGQGRDVIGAVSDHPRRGDVSALLVDNDESNCDYARRESRANGLAGVTVRCADAAVAASWQDAVPADVLLLCGIFGNVSDDDVEHTVRSCSRLCAPGATVLWTRHRKPPDLTVDIRRWFAESGFDEVAFETPDGDEAKGAVGVHRLRERPHPFDPELRLFTFVR